MKIKRVLEKIKYVSLLLSIDSYLFIFEMMRWDEMVNEMRDGMGEDEMRWLMRWDGKLRHKSNQRSNNKNRDQTCHYLCFC